MPQFSGKMKKEQLKEKRQRKREEQELDRIAESERERRIVTLIAAGVEVTEENIGAVGGDAGDNNAQRHSRRRPGKGGGRCDVAKELVQGSATDGDRRGDGHRLDVGDGEYMYGADRKGVRSVFKKESREEVEARRRLNYQPLQNRVVISNSGIPFGTWFLTPGMGTTKERKGEVEETTTGGVDSIVSEAGTSHAFPLSLEIPSRGWRIAAGGDTGDIVRESNKVVNPNGGASDETDALSRRSSEATDDAVDSAFEALIDGIEKERFALYLRHLESYPPENSPLQGLLINSYERNLDVWRQLWRAVEVSDVVVLVADARYPIIHIPLALLSYVTKDEQKPCVVVFNKSDLVLASVLECWMRFITYYLRDLGFNVRGDHADEFLETEGGYVGDGKGNGAPIVLRTFTANPESQHQAAIEGEGGEVSVAARRRKRKQRRSKMYEQMRAGTLNITDASGDSGEDSEANSIGYAANVNFKGMKRAEREMRQEKDDYKELTKVASSITSLLALCKALGPEGKGAPLSVATAAPPVQPTDKAPLAPHKRRGKKKSHRRLNWGKMSSSGADTASSSNSDDGNNSCSEVMDEREEDNEAYMHIAFVGFPNVGKSSLLNCIRGTKVVSVSSTAGHTKHVQTIPIPIEGVTLVDSPGLAVPILGIPGPLQAVIGTHQLAQTRDPQSGVAYLASYLPIEKLYGLRRPEGSVDEDEWSAYELCEAYAQKRGYFVKHGKGALDLHRAAIALLQEAYDGRVALYFAPPEMNLLKSKRYKTVLKEHLLLPVFWRKDGILPE